MRKHLLCIVLLIALSTTSLAGSAVKTAADFPIYVGASVGTGSTTWEELIDKQSEFSTPIAVTEGNFVWGVFVGYQFEPAFALEARFVRFPTADVWFAEGSIYQLRDGITHIRTGTDAYSLVGKFMAPVFHTGIDAFALAGVADVHRRGAMAITSWRLGGAFGGGFLYNITPHIMAQVDFQYYTGYAKSEDAPAYDYIPFLYSANFSLAYRFTI